MTPTLAFVMAKVRTEEEVIELLKKRQGERSLRQFASEENVSAAYISDIYCGRRAPGAKILAILGLKRRVTVKTEYIRDNGTPELKATTRSLQASAF